jgi:integrase
MRDRAAQAFIARHRTGRAKAKKITDGGGMFLTLTPAGSPVWRLKYRIAGKERLCSLGVYPAVGLSKAREDRDAMRASLAKGRDPVTERRLQRADQVTASGTTFAAVSTAWLGKQRRGWCALHYARSRRALERDVLPLLGSLPVSEITPAMVARTIEAVEARGARETAGKVLQHCSGVFRFAQARGLCRDNPASPVREVLTQRRQAGRRPAVLELKPLGDILRLADEAHLSRAVRMAHRLCAFTAARIGNVVSAEWSEFDLDAKVPKWTIPRRKMKVQDRQGDHTVILCATIANELRAWRRVAGPTGYAFPSPTGGAFITRESLEKVYRVTLGLADRHTPHGWRSAFSTLARDNGFARDVVELTLDHIHDNAVARAYDRGERLIERVRLMRWWGGQLDKAQGGTKVIPLHAQSRRSAGESASS